MSVRTTPAFNESDIAGRTVFGRLRSVIGFFTGRQRVGLALAVCVPLIVFWAVTTHEGRFAPGSLFVETSLAGKAYHLIGMSFLGDPMVWGFTILVPSLIAALELATRRTVKLVNTSAMKAITDWQADKTTAGFDTAIERTKQIWKMRGTAYRKTKRFLRYGPWFVSIAFWVYNTLTCDYRNLPWLPLPDPYVSDRVTLIAVGGNAAPGAGSAETLTFSVADRTFLGRVAPTEARRSIQLTEKAPLRKWDCERKLAPWSFWLTRLWTPFYYGVIPFLVRHLALLVWGATSFLRASSQWENQAGAKKPPALEINPFEPDGFGGLGALSDAVIIYLYCVSILASLLGLSFLKEGTEPAWHNYVLMVSFLPAGVWAVLTPALAVRHAIVSAKEWYLHALAGRLHKIGIGIVSRKPDGTLLNEAEIKSLDDQKKVIRSLYDDVNRMKEWPFDALLITRILLSVAAPWLPAAIKEIAKGALG